MSTINYINYINSVHYVNHVYFILSPLIIIANPSLILFNPSLSYLRHLPVSRILSPIKTGVILPDEKKFASKIFRVRCSEFLIIEWGNLMSNRSWWVCSRGVDNTIRMEWQARFFRPTICWLLSDRCWVINWGSVGLAFEQLIRVELG